MTTTISTSVDTLAAVCCVSMKQQGGLQNITYIMSVFDAKVFCSQPETAGQHFMFVWSALHRFVDERTNRVPARLFKADDGRFDGLIARLGLTLMTVRTSATEPCSHCFT